LFSRALCIVAFFAAHALAEDRFTGLDDYIREAMEKWQVPGLAIAVVKDGDVVLARGFGTRNVGRDEPVGPETVFSIASCTKSFTAACIAMLVDEGKLDWDDPVGKHLPDFRVADPYVTEHATIRDLLCHRTGLVRGDLLGMNSGLTRAEMFRQVQFLPQAAPFRTKVTYNNLMFAVLGEIIEKKTGLSWHEFVAKRIFEPLEMKATTADRASVAAGRLAIRHRIYDGRLAPLRTRIYESNTAPAGAIHSTVGDMARWLRFHLQEGEFNGRRLIPQTAMREMHAMHQSIPVKRGPDSTVYDSRFVGTGLGWFVSEYRGRKVIQHGGGWGAEMAFLPEEGLGVIVLSNRDWNGLVWMLIADVIDAYVVGPEQAWTKGKKWDHWLPLGGPDAMDRERKKQLTDLEKHRKNGTQPSLPLAAYAGKYRSALYYDLDVTVVDGRLRAQFGDFAGTFDHWDGDTFYSHAVIEPFLDWHVKFDLNQNRAVSGLEIINIGWKDPDERFLFTRQ
jgi:CubicO group peptidase (beta-lactamase class C family)